MAAGPPLSPGEQFLIFPWSVEHTAGDLECPACESAFGIHYPRPHEGAAIKHLEFLVHGEWFSGIFHQRCEGGCPMSPIIEENGGRSSIR